MLKKALLSTLAISGGALMLVAQTPVAPTPAAPAPAADAAPAALEPPPIEPPAPGDADAAAAAPTDIQTVQALETAGPGRTARDFQGDDLGTVLRLLARQAKINLYVSEQVQGTLTLRLEDKTPIEAIQIVA